MTNFMHKEIEEGKNQLIELGNYVKESFDLCHDAFINFDRSSAKEIILRDDYVDKKEVEIEEEVIRYISLYQPVASDLRLIISMLKINYDLERIHDSISNICQTIRSLKPENKTETPQDFDKLFITVKKMLSLTLEAFFNVNSQKALEVCQKTKELKKIKNSIFSNIEETLEGRHEDGEASLLHITFALKNTYRIGKHSINIAEDVYYLKKGVIIRHHHPEIEKA